MSRVTANITGLLTQWQWRANYMQMNWIFKTYIILYVNDLYQVLDTCELSSQVQSWRIKCLIYNLDDSQGELFQAWVKII